MDANDHPGHVHSTRTAGLSSDAGVSSSKGWGGHAFCTVSHGTWALRTSWLFLNRRFSINAAELMVATATFELIDGTVTIPTELQFALRCDKDAACVAVKYAMATSAAMRDALRIWMKFCDERRIRVQLIYI